MGKTGNISLGFKIISKGVEYWIEKNMQLLILAQTQCVW